MTEKGHRSTYLSNKAAYEVGTIYVADSDRFIVSLIVGYSDDDLGTKGTIESRAKVAAAAALSLTTDDGSPDTYWFVYDRKTRQSFTFEQGEFDEIPVP